MVSRNPVWKMAASPPPTASTSKLHSVRIPSVGAALTAVRLGVLSRQKAPQIPIPELGKLKLHRMSVIATTIRAIARSLLQLNFSL